MLSNSSLEQSLMKAKSHVNQGKVSRNYEKLYETILQKFSNAYKSKTGISYIK